MGLKAYKIQVLSLEAEWEVEEEKATSSNACLTLPSILQSEAEDNIWTGRAQIPSSLADKPGTEQKC